MAEIQNSNELLYKIQRVPSVLQEEEKNRRDYYPKGVSIGPYHHGNPALATVEAFKPTAVDLFTLGDGRENNEFYFRNILEMIDQVRNCYEQDPTVINCSDADLAEMMLRDASLIIIYMQPHYYMMIKRLGMLALSNLFRDFFLLENQIPLCVIKLLLKLRYGEGEGQILLDRFVNTVIYDENRQKREYSSPQGVNFNEQPLHLLEAFHRQLVPDCVKKTSSVCNKCRWFCCAPPPPTAASPACCTCTFLCWSRNHGLIHRFIKFLGCKTGAAAKASNSSKRFYHSFRTVTDLKAKGIYFNPSPTQSLKDVNFKSHFFSASLELPEWFVSIYDKPFFLNLVAFELIPYSPTNAEVSSYINLMKSLIARPEDVKELRERKIFYSELGSDEEVLSIYRDINTHGADSGWIFQHVKDEIQAHYNSRRQTWMAELIHANFRSPWTAIAFLAAVALLVISAAQLYYEVPSN